MVRERVLEMLSLRHPQTSRWSSDRGPILHLQSLGAGVHMCLHHPEPDHSRSQETLLSVHFQEGRAGNRIKLCTSGLLWSETELPLVIPRWTPFPEPGLGGLKAPSKVGWALGAASLGMRSSLELHLRP